MDLCSNNHDEVCYEGRECPACAVADNMNSEIVQRDNTISKLENQIGELEAQIEDLKLEALEERP